VSAPRFTLLEARGRPRAPAPTVRRGLDRREALALLASGAALALASCGKPEEEIVPYVDQPPDTLPGVPQRFSTALPLAGYARGMLAVSVDGRPIKIEGDARHSYSLGSTDVFAEAEVLGLYDPARLQGVTRGAEPVSWQTFEAALAPRLAAAKAKSGAGLTLVTGRITSPTDLRLIADLQATYPQMRWRRYEPVHDDAEREGARLAFGRELTVLPQLERARAVLCLDADPIGPGPQQIRLGRAFVEGRKPGAGFARWYAVEPGWSLTGMNADHRLALHPERVRDVALIVAARLGSGQAALSVAPEVARFAEACAADLQANPGAALVLAGPSQPAEVHALAHWINGRLRAPVTAAVRVDPHPEGHGESLRGLADDLRAGRVETLVVLDANPAYDAPAELGLAQAISRASFRVFAGTHAGETSAACEWTLPQSHVLESWGDARAPDGTVSLIQPLIRPLYDTRTRGRLIAMLSGSSPPGARDLVRATWADQSIGERGGGDADGFWRAALTRGFAEPAPAPIPLPAARLSVVAPSPPAQGMTLALRPDPTVWDGRYADNAWLQECPKPLTHEVWGASLAISPSDAARLNLHDGDHVKLSREGRSVDAPVRVTPGQADGVLSGYIGGGRREAGPIGVGAGVDFAPVRSALSPWTTPVGVERGSGHDAPPAFATTHRLEGEARKLAPVLTVDGLAHGRTHDLDTKLRPDSLLPNLQGWDPAWAMVIDTGACIGCNACVVACQAENNVPVVGPHEVARGRDMHWLRIDAYVVDDTLQARPVFQPVPCMQCEHAPCEPVCPVEASIHDHEGLNGQVYNRCIGTRFCESNCPYKVRRFNFHGYAQGQEYENLGAESVKAQRNPDVTVRARGVMEKCTYCVQRISGARRLAEREQRPIAEGEVVTACQSACPTRAIRFGDLNHPASDVVTGRRDPRHYALLGEQGTRPRTTYLARVRNPNPALEQA